MRKATHETNSRFLLFAILFLETVSLYCLIAVEYFFSFVYTRLTMRPPIGGRVPLFNQKKFVHRGRQKNAQMSSFSAL